MLMDDLLLFYYEQLKLIYHKFGFCQSRVHVYNILLGYS